MASKMENLCRRILVSCPDLFFSLLTPTQKERKAAEHEDSTVSYMHVIAADTYFFLDVMAKYLRTEEK